MDLAVIQSALIISLLIYDSAKDIKYREIPNEISAAIALTMVLNFNVQNLWGLAAAAVFFIAAIITGKIGGGDVKLIIALSVVCGLWGTVFLLFSAQLSMLIFYAVKLSISLDTFSSKFENQGEVFSSWKKYSLRCVPWIFPPARSPHSQAAEACDR